MNSGKFGGFGTDIYIYLFYFILFLFDKNDKIIIHLLYLRKKYLPLFYDSTILRI
jgi:hypothetical protein